MKDKLIAAPAGVQPETDDELRFAAPLQSGACASGRAKFCKGKNIHFLGLGVDQAVRRQNAAAHTDAVKILPYHFLTVQLSDALRS